MPDWKELLDEINAGGSVYDRVRRKYLLKLYELTTRNVIIYHSGWLQKQGIQGVEVNDADKNGLMTVVHQMDQSLGLDLLLHTPGGGSGCYCPEFDSFARCSRSRGRCGERGGGKKRSASILARHLEM